MATTMQLAQFEALKSSFTIDGYNDRAGRVGALVANVSAASQEMATTVQLVESTIVKAGIYTSDATTIQLAESLKASSAHVQHAAHEP